MQTILIRSFN